ncbi:hypothetical protein GCM10023350_10440 [Nocardioides endophyticus]|uniref:Collagen-like protein n=1 Tax=Nocardioides endophyticus TaxID=1353775 RepID=A0ABP8YL41_9ACTN
MRKLVYIAVGGILGLALSGGAAVAGGLIHGKDLAKGTITSRELGAKSVTSAKLSKSVKKQLGKPGPAGPAGPAGARGPAGGFDFVDQNGTVIGESVGFYSGVYPMVRMGDGTIVLYDNDPATSSAVALVTSIYYPQAGCTGTGYANAGGQAFQTAIITANPAIAGSQIYKQVPGTPQNFTAASVKNSSGCSASTTAVTKAYAVTEAGKVPAAAKPLILKPVG